ncbi:MAG: hypothetical protein ACSLEL_02350, partial [Candidatus Malihini olakiniferum]
EVKRRSADGSVGLPHVRVGNCQAFMQAKEGCPKRQPSFSVHDFYHGYLIQKAAYALVAVSRLTHFL